MVEGTLVRSLDHFQGLLRTPSSMGSQAQPRTCYQFFLVLYIHFDTLTEGAVNLARNIKHVILLFI